MATEAAQLENQEPTGRRKTDLTLTGLLMEGLGQQGYQDTLIRLPSSAANSTKLVPTTRSPAGRLDLEAGALLAEKIEHGGFKSPIGNVGNLGAVQSPQFQTIPFLSRGAHIR